MMSDNSIEFFPWGDVLSQIFGANGPPTTQQLHAHHVSAYIKHKYSTAPEVRLTPELSNVRYTASTVTPMTNQLELLIARLDLLEAEVKKLKQQLSKV